MFRATFESEALEIRAEVCVKLVSLKQGSEKHIAATLPSVVSDVADLAAMSKTCPNFHVATFAEPYDKFRTHIGGVLEMNRGIMCEAATNHLTGVLGLLMDKVRKLEQVAGADVRCKSWYADAPSKDNTKTLREWIGKQAFKVQPGECEKQMQSCGKARTDSIFSS